MLIVSGAALRSCQSREPQSGQKAPVKQPPLSVVRDQNFGFPRVTRKPSRGRMTEIPKAEADCFWHSRQWQT